MKRETLLADQLMEIENFQFMKTLNYQAKLDNQDPRMPWAQALGLAQLGPAPNSVDPKKFCTIYAFPI